MIWAMHDRRPWARTRTQGTPWNPGGNSVCGLELELEAAARFFLHVGRRAICADDILGREDDDTS
jgi:hypothetical protein